MIRSGRTEEVDSVIIPLAYKGSHCAFIRVNKQTNFQKRKELGNMTLSDILSVTFSTFTLSHMAPVFCSYGTS